MPTTNGTPNFGKAAYQLQHGAGRRQVSNRRAALVRRPALIGASDAFSTEATSLETKQPF